MMTFSRGQHEENVKPAVPEKPVSVELIHHCDMISGLVLSDEV